MQLPSKIRWNKNWKLHQKCICCVQQLHVIRLRVDSSLCRHAAQAGECRLKCKWKAIMKCARCVVRQRFQVRKLLASGIRCRKRENHNVHADECRLKSIREISFFAAATRILAGEPYMAITTSSMLFAQKLLPAMRASRNLLGCRDKRK